MALEPFTPEEPAEIVGATVNLLIDGKTVDVDAVTIPATGRAFRGAWTLTGNVISIDMAKARDIKIERIVRQALERVLKAEAKAARKAMKGESTAAEEAEIAKFKAKPKAAGVSLIQNAATPAALEAITEDQVFA